MATQSTATRARLVRVARRHLKKEGPGALSLREIARDAGVTPTAIYRHFDNKDALVEEITMAAVARFEQSLWRDIAPLPVGSLERLVRLGEEYIRFSQTNPGDFSVLFSPRASRPRKLGEIPERAGFGLLLQCVNEAMDSGALKRDDAALVALLFWARVHGIVHLLGALDFSDETPFAAGADRLTNVFNATSPMIFAGLAGKGAV